MIAREDQKDQPAPFVKWAGGKQGIAAELTARFPTAWDRYFEPFVGGGSVLFRLRTSSAVISDANGWLIDTYRAIRQDWAGVAEVLEVLPNTRTAFFRIRQVQPGNLDLVRRAAHFIYLNKTCFRGLFRVNRLGHFNVPFGNYNRKFYDPENLRAVSRALSDVEIRAGDVEFGLHGVSDRDFVYLDPPYFKLGGYSDFNRYTSSRFEPKDHVRLAALCHELDERGVRFALTNSNTSFVRTLFQCFRLETLAARREINLNSRKRDVTELLITNF